jgi:hypothetical protein
MIIPSALNRAANTSTDRSTAALRATIAPHEPNAQ